MRRYDTREIDGLSFTVHQMPVKRALKLMHKLARAAVPAMLHALGTTELKGGLSSLKLETLDLSNFGAAATMLFDKLSEADFDHCVQQLLESSTVNVDGNEMATLKALDVVVTDPMTVLKAMAMALEVNFVDFSAAFRAAAGTLQKPAAAPPTPQ